ncbi:glycine--tRNA ligase subunit beta [Candidatus Fukatsuia anoeciicola]|uniref:glycine--tRNA ligase subunit beta n=1 Tax=Candidatus Fukatsuia anoeciicola TaxID=2994492 RepID=UPI003464E27B
MTQQTFLVEIGTEELPLKTLRTLAQSFADNFTIEMDNAFLPHGKVHWFATPRRLALQVENLSQIQPDQEVEKRGPAIIKAYDTEGRPTKAAKGWAQSCGITLDQAKSLSTEKGEWLSYRICIKGKPTKLLLIEMVKSALSQLSITKLMRWGNKITQFVRPVHTVTLLLGSELITGTILGINSNRILYGHRFMAESKFSIHHAQEYLQILRIRGAVIADYEERKAQIKHDVQQAAQKIGGIADISENLLEEVTSLVEWPVVLTARFEEKFLSIPVEALVSTMKNDQKYFPVYDTKGHLLSHFIFVANVASTDPQQIILGNEKVIRPRLADAEFFFNTDRKNRLIDNLLRLETVLFQQQLGTLRDKTNRIVALAGWVASQIGADVSQATRAGLLSKCDLMTNMVFEFTDTQGFMGMHYARYDGEVENVALALKEQYQPRFAGDTLPTQPVSCALAIADKMDTLVGIFGINQSPKGNKDPFALRRAALGVLRIIIHHNLPLDIQTLSENAMNLYVNNNTNKLSNKNVVADVVRFMLNRFKTWYQEEGHSIDTIQAVLASYTTKPADFNARMQAISYFRTLDIAVTLSAVNKRVSNILAKSTVILSDQVDTSVLKEVAEIKLARKVMILREQLKPLLARNCYQEALVKLATLQETVDAFFDNVIVMTEDKVICTNRLTLLSKLRDLFLQIADISLLQ